MRCRPATLWSLSLVFLGSSLPAQTAAPTTAQPAAPSAAITAPLPDTGALLAEVERNQRRLEALQRDYTYHVHTDRQELEKNGGVKKADSEDAESLTVNGVRVNRVVARNGKPLTPEEQAKENVRIDKEVARASERRARVESRGHDTDERGNEVMPLSRILELGSFSNPRRISENGRPVILLDYTGNPQAKTHSAFEGIMRDVVGTLEIDETDRVLAAAQGHFLNDFKLGAGLLADVRKGTSFTFRTTRVGDGVWLPADITGQGVVRVLLFANFSGRLHVSTSDYKRFRTSATIVGSHGAIDAEGHPVPDTQPASPDRATPPDTEPPAPTPAPSGPVHQPHR